MKVLVVGPDSRKTKGGIASVIEGMREDEWLTGQTGMAFYASYREGNPVFKLFYGLWKIVRFPHAVKQFDLVHIHMSVKGSAMRKMQYAAIAKKHGKKVVLHIHGSSFMEYYQQLHGKKQEKLKKCLQSADCVLALSEKWQSDMCRVMELRNCEVLLNGISLKKYQAKIEPFQNRGIDFLFMGRLGVRKGTDNLLGVLKRMKKEGRKFHCVLAGDGPVQDYSQWVNEAQMEDCIRFAGWIQGGEKKALLKKARILLLPSRHEGLPMSILEAMTFGEAIISTKVGGIPEAVEEGQSGLLVDPDDEEGLYGAMCRLLDDPELTERMGRRGCEIVKQKFDLEQIHRQLYALYGRILGE